MVRIHPAAARSGFPVSGTVYLAALRWLKDNEIVRAWYEAKVRRDGGRKKGKAVVALMRKLLTGLWWVGQGRSFDVTRLFDVERLEGLT